MPRFPFVGRWSTQPVNFSAGVDVKIHNEDTGFWVILLVTPIMRRAQLLASSSETIFVDSTAACARNTVTVLLTATAAGAVPIAVMVHNSQTTDTYAPGFKLLKDNYPFCFGGFEVSVGNACGTTAYSAVFCSQSITCKAYNKSLTMKTFMCFVQLH